jgi:hypothetical protein
MRHSTQPSLTKIGAGLKTNALNTFNPRRSIGVVIHQGRRYIPRGTVAVVAHFSAVSYDANPLGWA